MKEVKMKFTKPIIIFLVICLVIAVGYIAFEKYNEQKQQEQIVIFQNGAQFGYEQAIMQLIQQAATCNEVPLYVGNQSIDIIAVGC